MKPVIVVTTAAAPGLVLRSAGWDDQEQLREWKNAHRRFFFFQDVITPDMQRRWFEGHLQRPDDHLFTVVAEGSTIGCMAVRRLEDGSLDVYNVIGGPGRGRGLMSLAIRAMCRFAVDRYRAPVRLKVLKGNPAVGWYLRNGFRPVGEGDGHLVLELDPAALAAEVSVEERAPEAARRESGNG
jgi:RimJ/RimL family protein N-acetyltransferase